MLASVVQGVNDALLTRTLTERLAFVRREVAGRIAFTSSFGLEDQAVTHAIAVGKHDIDIVTLDTGRLFPETYEVWAQTEKRYGCRIRAVTPEKAQLETLIAESGINCFRQSVELRKACCGIRKIEPLGRALDGAAAWLTGLRAEQSQTRAETRLAEYDTAYSLLKINPIADWTRADLTAFVRGNHIPYNMLHDKGFPSIGCAPCTRAVRLGEPERAGRWWWEDEQKKECGLHDRMSRPSGPPSGVDKGIALPGGGGEQDD